MDMDRTERGPERPLGDAARKRAFALAVTLMAAAGALIVLFSPSGEGEDPAGDPPPERTVVMPSGDGGEAAAAPALDGADLGAARAAASRFAVAYLARESGRMDAAARRVLRQLSSPALWEVLRRPPRATPVWQPPLASFGQVSGVTETPFADLVDVIVAYRVERRRRYLTVRLSREGGRWRALPHGL
jgi:hypothetical protein